MNILNKIVAFHLDLINSETPTSSRRYLAILFGYSVIVASFFDLFFKLTMTEFMFVSLCTMALTYAGLTTWSSYKQKKEEQQSTQEEPKSE